MVIPTISANTGAPPPPPTISIVGANSSGLEQLDVRSSGIDYSPRNSRSSFYFSAVESGLSARTTGRLRDREGSDEDECIVRVMFSPRRRRPTLAATRSNFSLMTIGVFTVGATFSQLELLHFRNLTLWLRVVASCREFVGPHEVLRKLRQIYNSKSQV